MANDKVQLYTGSLNINLQHLDGVIIDAEDGATKGWAREKPGFDAAKKEMDGSLPAHAATIGVAPEVMARIQATTDRLSEVRQARIAVAKQLEVLEETEAFLEDKREADIGVVVGAVRRVGKRNRGLLIHFEETMRYHGQIGVRAAKTRRKAREQTKAAPAAPASTAEPKVG
ncbi:MAG: hypothetical protein IT372_01610 [Polyangiaceae bacterium]|nr:hypothetical protein [Polyangiaceae bacterium]